MADIRAIIAPIGGGKSLFGVIEICRELERSNRLIVTDIPLILSNPPAGYWTLQEYCDMFIQRPVNVRERVAVMSYEQAQEFWRYLPAEYFGDLTDENIKEQKLEIATNEWKHGCCRLVRLPNKENSIFKTVPDFSFRTANVHNKIGCHYFIDEAHKKFPPMFYQKVGAQAEWYMSELRKLDDDLSWITQDAGKVDKNFRRDTTEWLHVRNMGRTSMFMGVTFPNRFRWHWYNQTEMPNRQDKPHASGWFRMDKRRRYHQLYKTMDGTGVTGGLLSEGQHHKGKHWVVWVLALMLIIAASVIIPYVVQEGVEKFVKGAFEGIERGATRGIQSSMPVNVHPVQQSPVVRPSVPVSQTPAVVISQPVATASPAVDLTAGLFCTGWLQTDGTNTEVLLSDGSIAYSQNGEVQGIGSRWVKVFGMPPIPIRQTANIGGHESEGHNGWERQ